MSGYPKADIYAPRTLRDLVRHPGFGMPPRVDELEDTAQAVRRSEWANLMRGQSVGKKANLLYQWVSPFDLPRSGPSPQPAAEMLFEIGGSDMDACQLQITLCNPLAIPASAAQIADLAESVGGLQNMSGEYSNLQMGNYGNYPGTSAPIAWPPFACVLEWGTGARTSAIVDFMNGQTVNLSASWVRAYAVAPSDSESTLASTSGVYTFLAFVGPGFPKSKGAQRSIQLGPQTQPYQSEIFITPPFARAVTLTSCDTSSPPLVTAGTISFYQDPGGGNCVGNYYVSGNQPGPFPVPNGGMYFAIWPGTGAAINWQAVFELAI